MTKTFKGYVPIEAPTFDLESPDGLRKLTVKCNGMVPGSVFLDFMANRDLGALDDLDNVTAKDAAMLSGAVYDLLKSVVRRDGWDEFKAFIDDPDNGVSVELLSEIAGYASELYANRPPAPPEA